MVVTPYVVVIAYLACEGVVLGHGSQLYIYYPLKKIVLKPEDGSNKEIRNM